MAGRPRSPLSNRRATYFRGVNYAEGQCAKICATPEEACAAFRETHGADAVSLVCATTENAAWYWDTDGKPMAFEKATGRPDGEAWTVDAAPYRAEGRNVARLDKLLAEAEAISAGMAALDPEGWAKAQASVRQNMDNMLKHQPGLFTGKRRTRRGNV